MIFSFFKFFPVDVFWCLTFVGTVNFEYYILIYIFVIFLLLTGFGSLGTIIEGPFIAFVMLNFGWSGAFYSMVILSFGASLAVGRAAIAEFRNK